LLRPKIFAASRQSEPNCRFVSVLIDVGGCGF
jgi:hypothetical protein